MTKNTKSLIKHILLGTLGGGALSSLYSMYEDRKSRLDEKKYREGVGKNQIVVPLSLGNYLSAVGRGKGSAGAKVDQPAKTEKAEKAEKTEKTDVSGMNENDLAALKRRLLQDAVRKSAEAPQSVKNKTTTVSSLSRLRKNTSKIQLRDSSGKFAPGGAVSKAASILTDISEDTKGTVLDGLGFIGGSTAGLFAVKMLADKIQINRKKNQIARARRRYVNAINNEVNDIDEPYYVSKTRKTAQDRGLTGQVLGLSTLTGIGAAGMSALLLYKILENRRKSSEAKSDKDNTQYPNEKSVLFQFAKTPENTDFFAGRRLPPKG